VKLKEIARELVMIIMIMSWTRRRRIDLKKANILNRLKGKK